MKRKVSPKPESEVERDFPISDRLQGWFFRVRETSASAFCAEGTDLYGRQVSRSGVDPDDLLEQCVADARSIQGQIS